MNNNTDTKTLRDIELIPYDEFYSKEREPNRVLSYEIDDDGDAMIILTWIYVSDGGFGAYQYMDEEGEGFKYNAEVKQPILALRYSSDDTVSITLQGSTCLHNRDYNAPLYVKADQRSELDLIARDILRFEQEINPSTKEVKVEIEGFVFDDDE